MSCLVIEAKRRIVLLNSCSKVLLNILSKRVPCVAVTCVATPCLTIPCMAHGKLHKTCMFHTMRKRGRHKHITGMHCRFLVALRV